MHFLSFAQKRMRLYTVFRQNGQMRIRFFIFGTDMWLQKDLIIRFALQAVSIQRTQKAGGVVNRVFAKLFSGIGLTGRCVICRYVKSARNRYNDQNLFIVAVKTKFEP